MKTVDVPKSMDLLRQLWKPAQPAQGMTLAQLGVQRDALQQSLERLQAITPNCHSCNHFDLETCKLHNAKIPHDFQKSAGECGDWVFDGIPF